MCGEEELDVEACDTCDGERKQVSPAPKIKAQVKLDESWAICTHFRLQILRFGTGRVAPLHRLLQVLLAAGGWSPAVGHRANSRGRCSNKEQEVCVRKTGSAAADVHEGRGTTGAGGGCAEE